MGDVTEQPAVPAPSVTPATALYELGWWVIRCRQLEVRCNELATKANELDAELTLLKESR